MPASGVAYPQLLRTPESDPSQAMLGILVGVGSYVFIAALFSQAFLGLFWLLGGDGSFAEFSTAAARFETPLGMLSTNLAIALLIPVALVLVRRVHRAPGGKLLSVQRRVRWRWLAISLALALIVFGVHVALMPLRGEPLVWNPQPGFVAFMAVVVFTTPLQAIGEEIFFRGYLLQVIGSLVRSPWPPILFSALLFAFFHGGQNLPLFLSRFAFGVVAGWLVVRTGGLEAAVAAHVVNNLFAWALAAGTSSVAEVRGISEVAWAQAFSDVLLFAIITILCAGVARGLRVPRLTGQPARG